MRKTNRFTPAREQRGFTLIEVLVAALVLSVGLLGLAGLQAVGQKLSHSAYQRSQAASLAYEMADAIRANAANAGDYTGTHGPGSCDGALSWADTGSVAGDDLAEWANRIACLLPGGQGSITRSDDEMAIAITWSEERARGTDAAPATDSGEDLRDQFSVDIEL